MEQPGDVLVQWWLDESALPELIWARLQINTLGTASVRDHDGTEHHFESIDAARAFLREDEYQPLGELMQEGRVPKDVIHPPSFI